MAQNIYDDPAFFAGYSQFPRSRLGLEGTAEWAAMARLMPAVAGLRVIDLGCGFGQLSRWAAGQGADSVLGIDLSENMLRRAIASAGPPGIRYKRHDLETLELPERSAELVVSSMALHYLADFGRICRTVFGALTAGGRFVFSVEHPIYAARAVPEWVETANGGKAWALTDYLVEGPRETNWIAEGVVKYHRTIGTMVQALRQAGFTLTDLVEWRPEPGQLARDPQGFAEELIRPIFLLMAADRPPASTPSG